MFSILCPSKSVLALDYDEIGKVRTKGWKKTEKENVESAVVRFSNLGFKTFLLTAIERDGMLKGPDFVTLSRIRKLKTEIRIIASGNHMIKKSSPRGNRALARSIQIDFDRDPCLLGTGFKFCNSWPISRFFLHFQKSLTQM